MEWKLLNNILAGGHLQQTTTTFLLDGITLTPGNVLIAVHGRAADNYGDNQLIRVCPFLTKNDQFAIFF